jgi:hypothetical protein
MADWSRVTSLMPTFTTFADAKAGRTRCDAPVRRLILTVEVAARGMWADSARCALRTFAAEDRASMSLTGKAAIVTGGAKGIGGGAYFH